MLEIFEAFESLIPLISSTNSRSIVIGTLDGSYSEVPVSSINSILFDLVFLSFFVGINLLRLAQYLRGSTSLLLS